MMASLLGAWLFVGTREARRRRRWKEEAVAGKVSAGVLRVVMHFGLIATG